jgi:hypothetical protein
LAHARKLFLDRAELGCFPASQASAYRGRIGWSVLQVLLGPGIVVPFCKSLIEAVLRLGRATNMRAGVS